MRRLLPLLVLLSLPALTPTPPVYPVFWIWPTENATLTGTVRLQGHTAVSGFREAWLEYQPAFSETATSVGWLPIVHMTTPVVQGFLAEWDTTPLTPGRYFLRLRVLTQMGEVWVHQVTVWVNTAAPTHAATPTLPMAFGPAAAPPTPRPWPTPLPGWTPEPAAASPGLTHFEERVRWGVLAALVLVVGYLLAGLREGE